MNLLKSQNLKDFLKEEFGKILIIFLLLYVAVFFIVKVVDTAKKSYAELRANAFQEQLADSQKQSDSTDKEDSILIPKIQVEAPIVFVDSTLPENFTEPLKRGVVHFPSALPGQEGQTIILGHSAPAGMPKINYNWVFSELHRLEIGDEIYVFFNNRRYRYEVEEKTFLQSGQEVPSIISGDSLSELVLISCWPPGIDHKRIAVQAKIQP